MRQNSKRRGVLNWDSSNCYKNTGWWKFWEDFLDNFQRERKKAQKVEEEIWDHTRVGIFLLEGRLCQVRLLWTPSSPLSSCYKLIFTGFWVSLGCLGLEGQRLYICWHWCKIVYIVLVANFIFLWSSPVLVWEWKIPFFYYLLFFTWESWLSLFAWICLYFSHHSKPIE